MKYFKEEDYKGYKIVIRGNFKEGTTVLQATKVYYDSVSLDMYIKDKFGRKLHQEFKTVETLRDERNKMFKEVNESVGKLYKNATEIIDKIVREKEMTDGLPDSLLANEETDLFDAIYEVAKVAIKDHEKDTVEKVAEQLIKAYKKTIKTQH